MVGHDTDIDTLGYEDARDELIAIVAKLEAGAATLEESLELWERGEALAARCQELLEGARDRITTTRGGDDEPTHSDEVADVVADAGVIGIVPAGDSDGPHDERDDR